VRLFFLGSILLLSACGEAPAPETPPAIPADPEFVGSRACGACHEQQFSDWSGSHHDLAMQHADESTVLGDFNDVEFEYFGTISRFFMDGERFIVRTQNDDGELTDYAVAYTYGVTPLQQYLVEFPNGHLQPLPFAWDARAENEGGQRWYHLYPDEYIAPGDELFWTGRRQNWNFMCAECHSTNVALNYDVATDSYDTTWSEINVACEACHGPGSVHVAMVETGTGNGGLVVDLDDRNGAAWQMNLDTGIAERSRLAMRLPQQPEACGRCHARRGVISEDYEYGQPLAHTHRPALLHEPLYFPDGQIRDEVYVYGSFLQSRMYQAGVSCSDCHNPHSLQLHTGPDPDLVCAQCHLPDKFAGTEHHGHEVGQVQCVDCHMPDRVYMVVDPRRDHSLRIPRPDLSLDSDAPNACTMCHEDRDDNWAATAAGDWWGEPAARQFAPPGIVRATALASLVPPLHPDDAAAVERSLSDADAHVRRAAIIAAVGLRPESQLQLVGPLLADDVRGVRIEAAALLAPLSAYLPPAQAASFAAAADEFRDAQYAIASRPQAHAALAEFEADMGNVEQALLHSDQAKSMAPEMAVVRHSRGLLLVRAERREEALVELRVAAELAPEVARFVYVYAVALNSLGDPEEALRVLEEAQSAQHPDDPDINNFIELLRAN
jgi:Tfp pilus assembly protein PilF